jgi:serine protease
MSAVRSNAARSKYGKAATLTWTQRTSAAALLAGVTAGALGASSASASTSGTTSRAATAKAAAVRSYRHGIVPMRGAAVPRAMIAKAGALAGANDLTYGGGTGGVGVSTGAERVYLVFWGKQWGKQASNAQGYATFSGDPKGVAPRLQAFFKGLGTAGETWSGVMTQYCQGIAMGATSCPSSAQHAAYPTGGALAGVWVDTSVSAPGQASGHQIGSEAVAAATHFNNTTAASNRNSQYVIVSPTGTNPDNYKNQGFCAWHDYTADSGLGGGPVGSPDGILAFTNLPYIPDAGQSCGAGFVNKGAAGALDGVTIVEGHEYAETVTDEYPAGGWTDPNGAENGDKCAWISSGQGASANLHVSTGTFAVQTTWSNDFNGGAGGCQISHSIFGQGDTITIANPGGQDSLISKPVSLQIKANDSSASHHLAYVASGLPSGLTINPTSGLISGKPTKGGAYKVTVRAYDSTKATASMSFGWTITTSLSCKTTQLLGNSGFETGNAAPWSASTAVITQNGMGENAKAGQWFAWLDGLGVPNTDTLSQTVTISPACHHASVNFWMYIDTIESTSKAVDTLKVQLLSGSTVLATLGSYSNLNANNSYVLKQFNVSQFAGRTVTLLFTGTETDQGGGTTDFLIDNTGLWEGA